MLAQTPAKQKRAKFPGLPSYASEAQSGGRCRTWTLAAIFLYSWVDRGGIDPG